MEEIFDIKYLGILFAPLMSDEECLLFVGLLVCCRIECHFSLLVYPNAWANHFPWIHWAQLTFECEGETDTAGWQLHRSKSPVFVATI